MYRNSIFQEGVNSVFHRYGKATFQDYVKNTFRRGVDFGCYFQKPNRVWVSDITYIRLNRDFSYLCVVMDLKTRAVLSHKLSSSMDDSLVTDTIKDALEKHKSPDIFNSDQGSQYTANRTTEILKKHNISISMDAKGRCFDNIYMERFFRSLKQENIYPSRYETLKDARLGISNYMKTYNWRRLLIIHRV